MRLDAQIKTQNHTLTHARPARGNITTLLNTNTINTAPTGNDSTKMHKKDQTIRDLLPTTIHDV